MPRRSSRIVFSSVSEVIRQLRGVLNSADPPAGTSTSPKEELERMLAHRPDRDELVGRNILPSEWQNVHLE